MEKYIKNLMQSSPIADHFMNFLIELYVAFVHKINVLKYQMGNKKKKGLKINFGSGRATKSGFLNLDFSSSADLRLDLRKPLPLLDSSCSLVYSEHFVEHLSYPEGVETHFSECYRILEPNGKISISVPDTQWPLIDYVQGKNSFLVACKQHNWHHKECSTFMEHINYHFRQRWAGRSYSHFENHRFAWDFETMKKKLVEFGFVNVERRNYNPNLDSMHREVGSLFVQASKPNNKV
ncbi:methyltransferase domain-containing protein [Pseudozobellia sp. WGM2]|uniref:class I SAM-dependent methyltransferase n=1 Tax=Pseudozobellia sp. WGM2 TaxID=2787625 RepID=UPI001ADFB0DE|nr:methyltransferase domain-containing protein [Pseudozobellia sp. WGM2]